MDKNFEINEIIICVIDSNVSLTLFKEYKVIENSSDEVCINNDNSDYLYYTKLRFIRKDEMRKIKINKIIKN